VEGEERGREGEGYQGCDEERVEEEGCGVAVRCVSLGVGRGITEGGGRGEGGGDVLDQPEPERSGVSHVA
jgi:hypothetical protein